ncbi:MAG: glycosyltransferase family 2 protein [Bacteroidetes bacterium]|nr:glycosyltransferase family 2 protein [Pseudomonadota bacterium]MBS1546788.1 glycosyltransferase family 2 protein [Bacteroidota bacterium]MBS1941618.1 glycosyltransferase family 2 protein [Bacteroidota bacterium]
MPIAAVHEGQGAKQAPTTFGTVEISAVIITLNEEHNLARCLASVKAVADDIVIVDSYSTDGTERIAREHGARFVQHTFEGHIEQKNWAITQAKHPWVLSLDADEAVDDGLKQSILRLKRDGPQADGYTMNRLTNYCGTWIRHGGWYPDAKLRLWDSRKGKWGGTNPHDRYELHPGTSTAHLKGDLLHYSYHSISDHVKQADYFTTIAAKAMHARGQRPGFLKMLVSPVAKFLGSYVLQGGFRDGFNGFTIARISAAATFWKYAKLRQLWRQQA